MMIIQTRIFHVIGLISGGEDWRLEVIFADIQVLVHSRRLALLGLTTQPRLQLGHQGVFEEVTQDGAGVQAVDHGALQAARLALTALEGTEGGLGGVGWEEQGPGQGLWLAGDLARKIFQSVLLKNISV